VSEKKGFCKLGKPVFGTAVVDASISCACV
jgi:hypothetical protein